MKEIGRIYWYLAVIVKNSSGRWTGLNRWIHYMQEIGQTGLTGLIGTLPLS